MVVAGVKHIEYTSFVSPKAIPQLADAKAVTEAVLKKYPDLIKLNVSPFRTGGEISRLLFSYEMIREFDCKFKLRGREV